MRKISIYFSIILLLLSVGLTFVPNTFCQTANVKILDYSYYIDASGYVEVVGEVQNVGPNIVNSVYLAGSLLSVSGEDLSNSGCQILASYLLPGQKAPFNMDFPPVALQTADFSNIFVAISRENVTDRYQYQDLTIASSSDTIGTSGNYKGAYLVNGIIQNTGSQTAQNITVVGTFYNATGSVIAIGYNTNFVSNSLAPSGTVSFQIPAYDLNQSAVPSSQKISSYSLIVQAGGPILLNETAPISTPTQGGGGSQNSQSPTPTNSNPNNSSNPAIIYVIVIVIVIAAVAGALLALRKRKPQDRQQNQPKTNKKAHR
jgi:hypothetical protein